MASTIYGHFSSASYFLVVDTQTKQTDAIANCDPRNPDAGCNPFLALTRLHLDGIIAGGIGDVTIRLMNSLGFRVFEAQTASVEASVALFEQNALAEAVACDSHLEGRCSDDGGSGTCNHNHDHEPDDDDPAILEEAGCDPEQCNPEKCQLGQCG
jgi:predicted Fe-Mo cluster-binding NifX family protein